jgi:hypothetical protein
MVYRRNSKRPTSAPAPPRSMLRVPMTVLITAAATLLTLTVGAGRAEAMLNPSLPWGSATNPATSTAGPQTTASNANLNSLSCPGGSACEAVGDYTDGSGHSVTLAEGWNGQRWTVQRARNPAGMDNYLYSVSCASRRDCEAVGYSTDRSHDRTPLAERWNGKTWTDQAAPSSANDLSDQSLLLGVSCTNRSDCEAVGYYYDNSHVYATLAEKWNGSTWTVQSTPNPAGEQSDALMSVSCTTGTHCEAVGYYNGTSRGAALAEEWNGRTWRIQTTPEPTGARSATLLSVSCPSRTHCEAVGSYTDTSRGGGLAEGWNGRAWHVQTSLPENGASAVSCTTVDDCEAVGVDNGSSALAEAWNGRTWTLQTTPRPNRGGHHSSNLYSVSCTGNRDCEAAGYDLSRSGTEASLTERWNSKRWSL